MGPGKLGKLLQLKCSPVSSINISRNEGAFTTLEKTFLFQLVFPTTEVIIPALPKLIL